MSVSCVAGAVCDSPLDCDWVLLGEVIRNQDP